jgi:hypothetical protein
MHSALRKIQTSMSSNKKVDEKQTNMLPSFTRRPGKRSCEWTAGKTISVHMEIMIKAMK